MTLQRSDRAINNLQKCCVQSALRYRLSGMCVIGKAVMTSLPTGEQAHSPSVQLDVWGRVK